MWQVRGLRAVLAAVWLVLGLAPVAARAASVQADVDGDGVADVVRVSSHHGGFLAVRSAGHGRPSFVLRLPSLRGPVQTLVAIDVDRDGDLDLAARGTQSLVVRLWINDGHGRFHESAGPVRVPPRAVGEPASRFDNTPLVGESADASVELRAATVTSHVVPLALAQRGHTEPEQLPTRLDHPLALAGPRPPPSV